MSNKTRNSSILVLIFIVLVGIPIFCVIFGNVSARGISLACKNSQACLDAVAKEEEANRNAASSAQSANAYQIKVNELSVEIAHKESEIAQSEAEVETLKDKIGETEKRLVSEQEALAELLVNMHFESDAEPIRILAGSTSISDLAERAARNEVVKEQISISANNVKQTKEQLEADKVAVEELLAEQQQAKKDLVAKQSEQQSLVEKYEHDAEAYAEVAKAALAEQKKAEEQEQLDHPERYGGQVYVGSGDNTYPAVWRNDCPAARDEERQYPTYWGNIKIGGYVCECTSYAGWKAYEAYGVSISWGHAYSWDDGAREDARKGRNRVTSVDNVPTAGSIGQNDGGSWGHVFWVESVNADGSINVTEYNNAEATRLYTGSFHYGDFGARKIPS